MKEKSYKTQKISNKNAKMMALPMGNYTKCKWIKTPQSKCTDWKKEF